MSLQRLEIVKHIASLIEQAQIVALPVQANRGEPTAKFPAIGVFGLDERAKVLNDAPRSYMRTLTVQVDVQVGDADPAVLSDQAHALGDAVERIVLRDQYLGQVSPGVFRANDTRLVSASLVFEPSGRTLLAGVALLFEVDYVYETADDANPDIAAFVRAHVDWDFPSAGDPIDAQDDVEGLQG